MSRLKVSLRGAVINEIGLSPDREYIGGRKETCDIRLQAEKGISREHFKLKFEDGKWVLQSLSRFGEIYSLGQRIETIPLEHNQNFQIPPYEFTFSEVEQAVASTTQESSPDISESENTVIGVAAQIPYIKMISSQGDVREMLRLEFGDIWVAGRDSSCQIVIPDQRVSRRQFEIRKINGSFAITDMDSVNGTFLNGTPVSSTDPQPLKSGDAITVLDNTMYFELHDPNFQYRMDRLEVPPLSLVNDIEEIPSSYEQEMTMESVPQFDGEVPAESYEEEIYQQIQPQLEIPQSPFTGIPATEPNQYYSFQSAETPAAAKPTGLKKITSNKPLTILIAIIILLGAYLISENLNPETPAQQAQVAKSGDPFSRLTPEQQTNVKNWYDQAVKSMSSGKYTVAREGLERIVTLLPEGYKDTVSLLNEISGLELAAAETERLEREKVEKEESDLAIQKNVSECRKLIGPTVTSDQMSNCLVPSKSINPEFPDIVSLEEQAKKIEDDRRAKDEALLTYESRVKELQETFNSAEDIQKRGYPYKAITAYKKVVDSELPDPKKLKAKANSRIEFIKETIDSKIKNGLTNAEQSKKDGNLKSAIKSLRDALIFEPDSRELKQRLASYESDLKLQMMAIYQESVIDESFGYVEGNESRPGAKDKWKQILNTDLEDGEYYRRAYTKLKKYGVTL